MERSGSGVAVESIGDVDTQRSILSVSMEVCSDQGLREDGDGCSGSANHFSLDTIAVYAIDATDGQAQITLLVQSGHVYDIPSTVSTRPADELAHALETVVGGSDWLR